MKNELVSSKKVLYSGKYVVKTFHSLYDNAPGATEFYGDEEAPVLEIRLWLRPISPSR